MDSWLDSLSSIQKSRLHFGRRDHASFCPPKNPVTVAGHQSVERITVGTSPPKPHARASSNGAGCPHKARRCLEDMTQGKPVDAALLHADEVTTLYWQALLAQRPGGITTRTAVRPGDTAVPLARLVSEHSITTNTAAAGGTPA